MQVELLETVTSALVCLLQAQPSLADQVQSLGHIPQLCKQMVTHRQQGAVIKAGVLVLHQLATSEVCMLQVVPF
jgi:DnaJ family protein C protein 13